MAAPGRRAPLGRAVITLIVVDALLVLAFLVLLVQNRPGAGESGQPTTAASTPTDEDTAEPVIFASPTRNISCAIRGQSAGCEIAHIMYEPPTIEGCTGDVGHEIEVTADGAGWVCRSGEPPAPPTDDIPDLPWGRSISANGFTCTSENDGVTCRHDESGHFFSLARRVYSLD